MVKKMDGSILYTNEAPLSPNRSGNDSNFETVSTRSRDTQTTLTEDTAI